MFMRIIVTGGGTGGHIYPALAMARGLKEARPEAEILYVGTRHGLEARIVPSTDIPFKGISGAGLKRGRWAQNLLALAQTAQGFIQAWKLLREFRPQVVVGTGGYASFPLCWAAGCQGIPVILHEQNAFPGLANRFLSRKARAVCLTFKEAAAYFPSKVRTVVTGLPIRPEILKADRSRCRQELGLKEDTFCLLVVGGSQGARSINKAMLPVLSYWAGREGVFIWQMTGPREFEPYREQVKSSGIVLGKCGNIILEPYIYHMEKALAAADLVVGRAGASFLAEVLARGLPSILIPYPYAAGQHQEYNARAVAQGGAAVLIRDEELKGGRLLETINSLIANPQRLKYMALRARTLARPQALEEIVEVILEHI